METSQSCEFIVSLQQREVSGEQLPLRTASCGLDPDTPRTGRTCLIKAMSEALRIGMVISDMFVPGCPISYLNEGFASQTGPMTEGYIVEEIVEALRHADPLFCKLQNHKPDGSVYQLCLCLTPIFNEEGEYKYQIGCQVDDDPKNPETPTLIMELERVVRNLPQTLTGETPEAILTRTQELEEFLASITAGGTGAGPGGLTATPPSGSAPSGGGQPRPGASWIPAS